MENARFPNMSLAMVGQPGVNPTNLRTMHHFSLVTALQRCLEMFCKGNLENVAWCDRFITRGDRKKTEPTGLELDFDLGLYRFED
jgi:hypothetical protein